MCCNTRCDVSIKALSAHGLIVWGGAFTLHGGARHQVAVHHELFFLTATGAAHAAPTALGTSKMATADLAAHVPSGETWVATVAFATFCHGDLGIGVSCFTAVAAGTHHWFVALWAAADEQLHALRLASAAHVTAPVRILSAKAAPLQLKDATCGAEQQTGLALARLEVGPGLLVPILIILRPRSLVHGAHHLLRRRGAVKPRRLLSDRHDRAG